ncbi:MAG TPA: serine protease [Burkholderiales bacterium]|nr:serine protease [Burkholderiales bacterium]
MLQQELIRGWRACRRDFCPADIQDSTTRKFARNTWSGNGASAAATFSRAPNVACVASARHSGNRVQDPAVSELSTAAPAAIGSTEDLRLGDPVIAAGYPRGGKLAVSHGEIKGIHPLDGASVLQVSAHFEHRQSGGALFDAAGRLIGIIGFKAGTGADFNYVLPLGCALDAIHDRVGTATVHDLREQAFWERPDAEKSVFLRAASLKANQDWKALYGVAKELGSDGPR